MHLIGLTQLLPQQGTSSYRIPEELFPILPRLGEVFLLRDHANAGNRVRDGNLPDPGIGDGKEMDEDEIQLGVFFGKGPAVVTIEPGVDGVLIKYWILDLQLHLIAQKSVAATAINDH